jgi:DNA-binding Xre family transcriptional regulator
MHEVDKRIVRLVEWLIFNKKVVTAKEFCQSVDLLEQTYSKIKKGTCHFTVTNIDNICKKYNVNSNWIFGTEKNVFRNDKSIEITNI